MTYSLRGLDLLLAVLHKHGAPAELLPRSEGPVRAGDLVCGAPLDPLLADLYTRCDGGRLGDLGMGPYAELAPFNERARDDTEPRLQKLLRYGRIAGLAEYFATVPSLPGPDGAQPVVYLESYIDKTILPFASNVDRAFALYARYCDEQISLCGSLWGQPPINHAIFLFPNSYVKQVAQDESLVRMLRERRFDELVLPDEASREWVQSVLSATRSLA